MTLDFGTINIGGTSSGGGMPNGKTIHVEADGSGDFSTVAAAINSLQGKSGNGKVIIEIGSGEFTETETVTVDGDLCFFSLVEIKGQGTTSTTLKEFRINGRNKANIKLHGIKAVGGTVTRFSDISNSNLTIFDVDINSYSLGICSYVGGNILLAKDTGSIAVTGTTTAFLVEGGGNMYSQYAVPISLTNCTTGFKTTYGGQMRMLLPSVTYSNVTTHLSQTEGIMTSSGYIAGFTV